MADTVDLARSQGLSTAEATRLLAEHGRNELPADPGPTIAARVAHQLTDPMILLLCGGAGARAGHRGPPDAAIIAAVVVLNTTIGVVQDVRAQRAIDALSRMAAPVARVWRDGRLRELPAAELVPGDVVRLEAGDIVPADLSLIEAAAVEVDESAMTGESLPVARAGGRRAPRRHRGDAGTRPWAAWSGPGRPARSARSRPWSAAGPPDPAPAPARGSVPPAGPRDRARCALVVLALAIAQGESWTRAAVLAVSLGVAAVPESLPAVVTISLALGAHRMARRNAVVRRLPAVETLGSVTVLASDKTGTLTPGCSPSGRLWTPDGECEVSGTAYGVAGAVTGTGLRADGRGPVAARRGAVQRRHIRLGGAVRSGSRSETPSTWRCWWPRPRPG